jgi:NAD(P)-dependent dehydrogenase (short-subunit alcohol dehydrogenase family)
MTDRTQGVAVVTGAGTGLGRELAIELVRRGWQVAGFGRRQEMLAETATRAGNLFVPMPLDVGDADAVRSRFNEISRSFGLVSLLINNAAVYPRADFLDDSPQDFMRTVTTNLGGMVACSHAALGHMIERGSGRILNVSTFADLAPLPASAAYSVSKGAARIFTRALVADICDRFPDIVINDWIPGALATEMGIPNGLDPLMAARWGVSLATWHDRTLTGTVWAGFLEQLPIRSLKSRLRDALLMRSPIPRSVN